MAATGDSVKNMILAGLGAYSLTRERIEDIVNDMVDRGSIKEHDAETLIEKLSLKSEQERNVLKELVIEQMAVVSGNLGVVTRGDFAALSRRIDQLEILLDK